MARDEGGRPLACGGVWRSAADARSGELRKMYVASESRGTGLGRRLLEALELAAAEEGLERLYLETGTLQERALKLYVSGGYTPMPCFEPFEDEPKSRCFEKWLGSGS